jgi:hypothetical protein
LVVIGPFVRRYCRLRNLGLPEFFRNSRSRGSLLDTGENPYPIFAEIIDFFGVFGLEPRAKWPQGDLPATFWPLNRQSRAAFGGRKMEARYGED